MSLRGLWQRESSLTQMAGNLLKMKLLKKGMIISSDFAIILMINASLPLLWRFMVLNWPG